MTLSMKDQINMQRTGMILPLHLLPVVEAFLPAGIEQKATP